MIKTQSTLAEGRLHRLSVDEIKPGLAVWAHIIKKGAAIPATILGATATQDGGMLCTLELEVEDPFSNEVIRQVYKKSVHSDQLTRRQEPEPAGEVTQKDQGADQTEELEAEQTPPAQQPEPGATAPTPEIYAEGLDPASLTYYSRETLRYHGPHDQARRAYLRTFAQQRGYPNVWFTTHGQRSGYYQAGIPKGEEGWTRFLERAVQYDIYCAFVAAYAPGQLEDFLNDAARRGEIRLDLMNLVWTPSDHRTPR